MNFLRFKGLRKRWIRLIEREAGRTIIVAGLLTLLPAAALLSLRFENEPGKLDIPTDDPVRVVRTDFESRFGGGELVLAALTFDKRIDADAVRLIERMTNRMSEVEGVESVYSLTTATEFAWVSSLGIRVLRPVAPFAGLDRMSDSAVATTIDRLTSSDIYGGTIISRDGHAAAMAISMMAESGDTMRLDIYQTLDDVRAALAGAKDAGVGVLMAGTPVINAAMKRTMRSDLLVFGPLSLLVFIAVLTVVFRTWRPVVIGLTAAMISLIWSLGALPLTGMSMSIGLSMMIPLILAFALMQSVHHLTACGRRAEALWDNVVIPNMLCGATTAIGFLSLATSRLAGIREVGLYIGAGVVMTTILVNILVPAMMRTSLMQPFSEQTTLKHDHIGRVIAAMQQLTLDRPYTHVGIWLVASSVAIAGLWHLRVESNHLEYLNRDRQFIESFRYVDSTFGGILPLEIVVDIPSESAGTQVRRISELEDSLRAVSGMGSVISAVDFIIQAESNKPARPVPLRPPLYIDRGIVPSSVWDMMVRPTTAGQFITSQESILSLRIHCRARVAHSSELQRLVRDVEKITASHFPEYSPVVTGLAAYFVRVERYVFWTQIGSFALAFFLIVAILGLMSKTVRTGMAIIAVNLLPVLLIGGCMGWMAIPLDISTVMIAAIALGTVVDDTIHLTLRYRRQRVQGASIRDALRTSFEEVGRPIITTTLVMAIGFASLIPAEFGPTSYFGALSALTVIFAALADLLLLPTLILLLHEGRRSFARSSQSVRKTRS